MWKFIEFSLKKWNLKYLKNWKVEFNKFEIFTFGEITKANNDKYIEIQQISLDFKFENMFNKYT